MFGILSNTTDPFFNIASEEYFMRNFTEEFTILYRNDASVIVGKHQNTMAEVNRRYLVERNIPVIRRISGGGTVYHDPGNLNFCFIRNSEEGKQIDFKKHTRPVIDFLGSLNIPATLGPKNELQVNGLKFSGNAEHVYKTRILHHGTILFDANLTWLYESIRPMSGLFTGRGVKSNRATVTNLSNLINPPIDIVTFSRMLYRWLLHGETNHSNYLLTEKDIKAIQELAEVKYKTNQWNFGYSPAYTYRKYFLAETYPAEIILSSSHGLISGIEIVSSHPQASEFNRHSYLLEGIMHDPEEIEKVVSRPEFAGCRMLSRQIATEIFN
jgi:lipoate---protein ligase